MDWRWSHVTITTQWHSKQPHLLRFRWACVSAYGMCVCVRARSCMCTCVRAALMHISACVVGAWVYASVSVYVSIYMCSMRVHSLAIYGQRIKLTHNGSCVINIWRVSLISGHDHLQPISEYQHVTVFITNVYTSTSYNKNVDI